MTKKQAKECGIEVGYEILAYGDFTEEEKAEEDSFVSAFWEIVDNRKQYAGEITEDFRRESEWDGYEEGLNKALTGFLKGKEFPLVDKDFILIDTIGCSIIGKEITI